MKQMMISRNLFAWFESHRPVVQPRKKFISSYIGISQVNKSYLHMLIAEPIEETACEAHVY